LNDILTPFRIEIEIIEREALCSPHARSQLIRSSNLWILQMEGRRKLKTLPDAALRQ